MQCADRVLFRDDEAGWRAAMEFHGHLGPWLALGIKIGRRLVAETGAGPHFGFTVRVTCPQRTPVSCLLDGLQLATGATAGKQNLLAAHGWPVRVELRRDGGGGCAAILADDLGETFAAWMAEGDDLSATRAAWEAPDDEQYRLEPLAE